MDQCSNDDHQDVDKFRGELSWLRSRLDPSSALDGGRESDDKTKVLYGKDIVKQMMATTLSQHVNGRTLNNLTS